ncbi:hypothetical protein STCU_03903 [Strigomonas culicis]|nr:hypothetical protein STCU_03903 [Strigomonas culicis]|eukprot:EPY30766.1 hypothetical protein STCU_03903 [Strigomonas culicis]
MELHRDALKPHRITTWKMPGATMCNTAYVGKVAESSQAKFNYELFVATRTEEGFHLSLLDAHKLEGASNTARLKPDSVDNWFPNLDGALGGRSGPAATSVTAVSSSLGEAKSNSTVSEANVASIVRNQASKFCDVLKQVDSALLTVQQGTTSTMRMLQDSQFREEAQSMGRQFAVRNRQRLDRATAAEPATEPGMMSEKQHEIIESINLFVKEVEGGSAAAASTALKALLQKHLKVSVEKAAKEMERLDAPGSVTASISSTDSARLFRNAVDGATSKVLERTREFHELMRATLATSAAESDKAVAAAAQYTEKLRKSLQRLQEEVVDTKAMVGRMQSGGAVSAVDPDTLVARAVARAEQADWQGAFTVALESGDLTVLLAFLEHKVVQDNMALVTSPKTLSLPLFLGLCLQLSFELGSQPGAMPLRLHLLHLFYVEWDDSLQQIKLDAAKEARSASALVTVRRELTSVQAQLEEVDTTKLDRKSKNNLRLVNRLLGSLLSES